MRTQFHLPPQHLTVISLKLTENWQFFRFLLLKMLINLDSSEINASTNLRFFLFCTKLILKPSQWLHVSTWIPEERDTAGFLEAERSVWLTASIRPFTVGDFNINASNTSSVSFLTYKSTGREGQESHVTEGLHNFTATPGNCFLSHRYWSLAPPAKPQTPGPDNIQQG